MRHITTIKNNNIKYDVLFISGLLKIKNLEKQNKVCKIICRYFYGINTEYLYMSTCT